MSTSKDIQRVRDEWGSRLLILGHHYQRSAVLQHADETGDSLELARKAVQYPEAERIVFCGVRFMAESADILTSPDQTVFMPDPRAGCPMAGMADAAELVAAWETLNRSASDWVPIAYVNSTAAIKAFCGKHGGSTCTSSNARKALQPAFEGGRRVLFLPDEHLGRNTADDLHMSQDEVAVYDPKAVDGGLSWSQLTNASIVVWSGYCLVHTAFTVDQVRVVRERLPGARIIVHPEVPREVVRLADAHGSTSQIINYVNSAPDNAMVVVGTELNLVERLAEQNRGRITVKALSPSVCANMSKTNEENLYKLLTEWPTSHEVHVGADMTENARRALERMLEM